MPILHFLEVLLQRPIVPVTLGLIVAILYGAGRPVGLPRLFWHERRLPRFLAGLATTFLAAQGLVDAYLLDANRRFPERGGFFLFLEIGAGFWVVVVGFRCVTLLLGNTRHRRVPFSGARAASVAPLIHRLTPGGPTEQVGVYVHPAAFLAGVIVALAIAGGVLRLVTGVSLPPELDALIAALNRYRPVEDPRLHLLQAVLFCFLLVLFVVLRSWATPAVGICILLAVVLAVQGAIDFWLRNSGIGLLVVLVALWIGGKPLRKLRLPALAPAYAKPADYPPRRRTAPSDALLPLPFDSGFGATPPPPAPRRLIVVCASGGGIRAATWTAAILGRLDTEVTGFRAATRLITGASGGMVGAASWVARVQGLQGQPMARDEWSLLANAVGGDSLTPVARRLVFDDVPRAFLPWVNRGDRGSALEEAWRKNLLSSPLQIDLGLTFADLRAKEAAGECPSLVFSPMLVEDGRRLILSNRELKEVTDHEVLWLSSKSKPGQSTGVASQSAFHAAELFPGLWASIPLSTAARLSAAFPYVSPAAVLPTEPRRRVVDAGYYDNYGLELACGWLRSLLQKHGEALKQYVSGILVLQIRDNVSQLSVNPETDQRGADADASSAFTRALEGLTTPIGGVLSARESVMLFRNDAQLEAVSQLYADSLGADFLTTTIFEFRGSASLSWTLAPDELALLQAQASTPKLDPKIAAVATWATGRTTGLEA